MIDESSIFTIAKQFVEQTSQHVFLTGKAGTGKTTFLRHIVNTIRKQTIVAAPTGVAAINAGGVTLHSLFQLPFSPFVPTTKQDISHFSQTKLEVLRKMELLIIDEISMLRSDTLDAIDAVLQRVRRNTKVFGGVQILYIGDMFQLPPVVKDDEWDILKNYYTTQFFFHAHALKKMPPVYIELKKMYRQQDNDFIDLLNRVRNNVMQPSDFDFLNTRFIPNFDPPKDKKFITLTTHNFQADKINAEKLRQLPEELFGFEAVIKGEFPEYLFPIETPLPLKKGTQIMFVKNDSSPIKEYYNGKIGTITRLSDSEIVVLCENESTEILLHTETWENYRYTFNKESGEMEEEVLGTFTQYPVRPAWAITVHKSQGLTFNHIVLDINRAFAAGQAYVALSRCTSLEGIVLQSLVSHSCIQTDNYAIALSTKERPQSELEEMLKTQKHLFWKEKLNKYFDLKTLFTIFYEFGSLLRDKSGAEFDSAKNLLERMRKFAVAQEITIKKFQNQLQNISLQLQENDDFSLLQNRCQKAVEYFYPLYINEILLPLRENIDQFENTKKSKTYYKKVSSIEQDIVLFIEELKKIHYYDKPLIHGENLKIPDRNRSQPSVAKKMAKGDSAKLSVQMFKEGKTVAQISEERSLQENTIVEHLSLNITNGKVSVFELVSQEKVEKILPFLNSTTPSASAIKEQLGDDYSYEEIRAVRRHWAWLEKTKNQED